MQNPAVISYETWVDNIVAQFVDDDTNYASIHAQLMDEDIITLREYSYQVKCDITRWHEHRQELNKQKDSI